MSHLMSHLRTLGSHHELALRSAENGPESLCWKPRGLLTFGLWTPMIIGRSKVLGVESGGRPENQDEKVIGGVR